jgi:putative addiction module killer protein
MFNIEIYKTDSGKEPFVDWKEDLDVVTQARIDARIVRIQNSGNLGDFHAVGDGVLELRLDFGPAYRVYFGRMRKDHMLILLGGAKKSQTRVIKKAKQYWQDHLSS